jgi:copper(I)-binding protein
MKIRSFIASMAAAALMLLTTASFADAIKIGDLEIVHVQARATPPGAMTTGGYMIIRNTGSTDDTLIGGSATFAGKTEVHEMKMQGEVMKMRRLEQGLPIPAGQTVTLESGGYHMMFMRLQQALKPGESYSGTLVFANAGEVEVRYEITAIKGMKHHHHGKKDKAHGKSE